MHSRKLTSHHGGDKLVRSGKCSEMLWEGLISLIAAGCRSHKIEFADGREEGQDSLTLDPDLREQPLFDLLVIDLPLVITILLGTSS